MVSANATSCANVDGGKACIIFITKKTHDGDFGDGDGHSSASDWCNTAANNGDIVGATYIDNVKRLYTQQGVRFKALIEQNNSTVPGRVYYRPDETTKIAMATNGNLTPTLSNFIISGADVCYHYDADGNQEAGGNCSFWTGITSAGANSPSYDYNCASWTLKYNNDGYIHGYTASSRTLTWSRCDDTGTTPQRPDCGGYYHLACVAQ
jgi:hypothetical protein